MSESRTTNLYRFALLAIALVSAGVYAGSIGGSLVWDDLELVGGSGIGGGDTLAHCFTRPFLAHYYRPLVSVTFFLERMLWGRNPAGYHVVNVLLHVAGTLAFAAFLRAAFRRRSTALLGAALFAVQPVQVGAVAWIGGRTDALSALWTALFAWCLVVGVRASGDRRAMFVGGALVAYTAALLTKEQSLVLLPLVPFAFAAFRNRDARSVCGDGWVATSPFAAATAVFIAMGFFLGLPKPVLPSRAVGEWIAQVGGTSTYYSFLLGAPTPAWMSTYSLDRVEHMGPTAIGFGLAVGMACVIAALAWLRRHPARSWLVALGFVMLLPVSGIWPLPFLLVAPYRASVTGMALAALLADLLTPGSVPWHRPFRTRDVACGCITIVLFMWWVPLTVWGATGWHDSETFFGTVERYDRGCVFARYEIARLRIEANRQADAVRPLQELLDILFGSGRWQDGPLASSLLDHDHVVRNRILQNQGGKGDPQKFLAVLYANLGGSLVRVGDNGGAERVYRAGVAVAPQSGLLWAGLAYCLMLRNDYAGAESQLRTAVHMDPEADDAWLRLVALLSEERRIADAREVCRRWTVARPSVAAAWSCLAEAAEADGDPQAAQEARDHIRVLPAVGQ